MCARGSNWAPLRGPSTHPLGATVTLRLALYFVLAAALPSWAQTDGPVETPANWQRFEVGPVSFFAPNEVRAVSPLLASKEGPASKPQTATAVHYARAFQGPTLDLLVDYGNGDVLTRGDKANFQSHHEDIDAKRARFESFAMTPIPSPAFRFENFRVVRFADTGKPNMHLAIVASCDGATGCQEAEDIFRTIRFK